MKTLDMSYEELLAEIRRLQDTGKLPKSPTLEERISWVYGNTKLENDDITREMVARAIDEKDRRERLKAAHARVLANNAGTFAELAAAERRERRKSWLVRLLDWVTRLGV